MNKKFTTIYTAILLLSFSAQSQITDVPGATQQPKWFMPIIIEDATQSRDTIYLGSDPSASSFVPDPIFGEIFMPIVDPSEFRATIVESLGQAIRVQILAENNFEFNEIEVQVANAMYPIKVYWDDIIRLHSDSLPFVPIELNGPSAQLFIYPSFSFTLIGNPNHEFCWQAGAIISDTLSNEPNMLPIADTMYIDPWVQDSSLNSGMLVFTFTHWTGDCSAFLELDKLESNLNVEIVPNPAATTAVLYISRAITDNGYIEILDGSGRIIQKIDAPSGSMDIELNLNNCKAGMYYVRLKSKDLSLRKKLLIY